MPLRRVLVTQPARPRIVVVCDDTKTAVAYFETLRETVRDRVTVEVVAAPCAGASPEVVVATAQRHIHRLFAPGQARIKGDAVWALIDREAEREKQQKADRAQREAAGKRYQVALSQPCYEVWTLAHLADTGEHFRDCKAVVERIKVEWKKQFGTGLDTKGEVDSEKLMALRMQAVDRARKRRARNDPSWTEVYRVVKAIDAVG